MAGAQLNLFDQKPRRQHTPPMHDTLARRLFCKVVIDPVTGCWNFAGSIRPDGYGQICIKKPRLRLTHIVAWELFNGPIAPGHAFELHHVCENRRCCRPDEHHVQRVTNKEHKAASPNNVAYKHAQKTHCPRGHPLSGDNLRKTKYRKCRICYNERMRAKSREYYRQRRQRAEQT